MEGDCGRGADLGDCSVEGPLAFSEAEIAGGSRILGGGCAGSLEKYPPVSA